MKIYKHSEAYYFYWGIGIFFSICCLIIGGYKVLIGFTNMETYFLFIVPCGIIFYLLFFLPREIVLLDNGIIYKTKIRHININFNQIKKLTTIYSHSELLKTWGNVNKANMVCKIQIKDEKYFNRFRFGSTISNYKKLCLKIIESLGKIQENDEPIIEEKFAVF